MGAFFDDHGDAVSVSRHDRCIVQEQLDGYDVVIERRVPGAHDGERTVLWAGLSLDEARSKQGRVARDFR
jgi:hypothetical protein